MHEFSLEIMDRMIESKLNLNMRLIGDEWNEARERRRVLEQRINDIRREKGELLPQLQVCFSLVLFFFAICVLYLFCFYLLRKGCYAREELLP